MGVWNVFGGLLLHDLFKWATKHRPRPFKKPVLPTLEDRVEAAQAELADEQYALDQYWTFGRNAGLDHNEIAKMAAYQQGRVDKVHAKVEALTEKLNEQRQQQREDAQDVAQADRMAFHGSFSDTEDSSIWKDH